MKELLGLSKAANASGSNPDTESSSLSAPAIYIDPQTGNEVSEDWWPEIEPKE